MLVLLLGTSVSGQVFDPTKPYTVVEEADSAKTTEADLKAVIELQKEQIRLLKQQIAEQRERDAKAVQMAQTAQLVVSEQQNRDKRQEALQNLQAVIQQGQLAEAARRQTEAQETISYDLMRLRIQQAYPNNPARWGYLERNPRYISHYLQDR